MHYKNNDNVGMSLILSQVHPTDTDIRTRRSTNAYMSGFAKWLRSWRWQFPWPHQLLMTRDVVTSMSRGGGGKRQEWPSHRVMTCEFPHQLFSTDKMYSQYQWICEIKLPLSLDIIPSPPRQYMLELTWKWKEVTLIIWLIVIFH